MALAAAGHRPAFEALAGRHLPGLVSYCAKFLGDRFAGEEIAHDVLLDVWRQRARYEGRGRLRILLFMMARHRCRNRLRDDGRRRAWRLPPGGEPGGPAQPGEQLERLLEREREARMHEAVAALSSRLREAVLLRFDQGLSYAEIAAILGRREVTIRSRVFHALRRLRAGLGEERP
jgi:RNA polymerase sigma-70 factor (ECF subfamily)